MDDTSFQRKTLSARLQHTVFIRLSALRAYQIFGPWEWALIRSWALIKISPFAASVGCLFCNKSKKIIAKREDVTNQVSVKYSEGNSVFGEVSY